jgi:adenylylsulfate reductase subunit B
MWTVKFRNGNVKRFKFPIRTTPEGSIKPYEGKPAPGDLNNELLFTEAAIGGAPKDAMGKKFDVQDAGKAATYMEHGR